MPLHWNQFERVKKYATCIQLRVKGRKMIRQERLKRGKDLDNYKNLVEFMDSYIPTSSYVQNIKKVDINFALIKVFLFTTASKPDYRL